MKRARGKLSAALEYRGTRTDAGAIVLALDEASSWRLDPRFDLANHSPTGFEWGYTGSEPAQLALALCADALGDDARALAVYQELERLFVAGIADDEWRSSRLEILAMIEELEARSGSRR